MDAFSSIQALPVAQAGDRCWTGAACPSRFPHATHRSTRLADHRQLLRVRPPVGADRTGARRPRRRHRPQPVDAGRAGRRRARPARVAVRLDVTDPDDRAAAIAAAVDRFGRLDVLVNNAGFGSVGAVEEIEDGPFRALMETMFFGALALTQAALPVMRRQGSGAIVQISSMGGQVTMPGFGAYCAAKFALEAVSESLAAEVNAVRDPRADRRAGRVRDRIRRRPDAALAAARRGLRRDRRADARSRRRDGRIAAGRSGQGGGGDRPRARAPTPRRCIWRSATTRSTRSAPPRTPAAPTSRRGSR